MNGRHYKHNASGYPDALLCEAEGLKSLDSMLKQAGVSGVRIPSVYRVDEHELELDRISAIQAQADGLALLGEGLAQLHKQQQPRYGWRQNNYIGLAPQINGWHRTWGEFFVNQRLRYQVSRIQNPAVRTHFENVLEEKVSALVAWLNRHCDHPSLLHGDLWSGNVLFGEQDVWLIDPAVYCGDREADLAMTEMFGGFGRAFYEAYDRVFPRTAAYPVKREIYNLYHYLNHYNLFGSGYLAGCERGFARVQQLKD